MRQHPSIALLESKRAEKRRAYEQARRQHRGDFAAARDLAKATHAALKAQTTRGKPPRPVRRADIATADMFPVAPNDGGGRADG